MNYCRQSITLCLNFIAQNKQHLHLFENEPNHIVSLQLHAPAPTNAPAVLPPRPEEDTNSIPNVLKYGGCNGVPLINKLSIRCSTILPAHSFRDILPTSSSRNDDDRSNVYTDIPSTCTARLPTMDEAATVVHDPDVFGTNKILKLIRICVRDESYIQRLWMTLACVSYNNDSMVRVIPMAFL